MGEQIDSSGFTAATAHQPLIPPPVPVRAPFPNVTEDINKDARIVYNYHRMNIPLFNDLSSPSPLSETGSTAIFTLCSLDIRVAHRAASLFVFNPNHYSHLIFSGKVGALTAGLFNNRPEAEVFAEIATSPPYNIPHDRVIIEPEATNTGENVRFTYKLLQQRGLLDGSGVDGIKISRFVLVQKPYMERRTYATFVKQWPGNGEIGKGVEFTVTSPQLEWEEYPDKENPRELVISIMVGDLVRIREYPARGYQIEQDIPEEVWEAGQRLIKAGFGGHLP
ncbi:duf218 domain containing protein [Naviculisporaceae sp. PSN 640]